MKLKDLFEQPKVPSNIPSGKQLTLLKGLIPRVSSNFFPRGANVFSLDATRGTLHNIHKTLKFHNGILEIPSTVESHILGVMFIDKLKSVAANGEHNEDLEKAITIINKHLAGDRNPHECQEELIDAGFSEYAKI